MQKIVLYFIGTQYTSDSPIFNVRGTIYQPKGLGSAIEVREVDVADLISKSITYGGGRAYQGFTRDPNLAAAVKQGKKPAAVDATLAEQAQLVAESGDKAQLLQSLLGGGAIQADEIMAFLESQKSLLPSTDGEEQSKKPSSRRKKAEEDTSDNAKEE